LLAVKVYQLTGLFPSVEKYGMTSQMRRAVISISSNIAEGSSMSTAKDQARFYNMAYSSLMETLSQLLVAADLNWLVEKEVESLRIDIEKISNKLNALRNSIKG
jgi:four helix bundle protein